MKKFLCLILLTLSFVCASGRGHRTVYATYILHGNMNYDRYVRPVIWKEFPVIYDGLLDFMDEHPDFKGQLQFSGQTFASLQQTAPQVIEHARRIHERGQLNFTGTFYSEPVNVNMDGETNYRCAWLGTKIIEDNVGKTDGFYLQERAYHAQLPWILNRAGITWAPVITGDDSYFPFRLHGMDGSLSVCVPVTRKNFIAKAESAPADALLTIEEDYEIPQTFTKAYGEVKAFNETHKDVRIEWITVDEYIRRFGVKGEKLVDHSAKASVPEQGSYSRWTADPLDIMIQDKTNEAMKCFRVANALDALTFSCFGENMDISFCNSAVSLSEDPMTWNIERADLYPEHEKYLLRDGETTVLSKAEHLLLWAVNSDAKGWFPLFEKRAERLNSLKNSSNLSRYVIKKALSHIGSNVAPAEGYDAYYVIVNMEAAGKAVVTLETDDVFDAYDLSTGECLRSSGRFDGTTAHMEVEVNLPAYGYKVIGTKRSSASVDRWTAGTDITNGGLSLRAENDTVVFHTPLRDYVMHLDAFCLKALAHMDVGGTSDQWRAAGMYGQVRTTVCNSGLYPRLRIEYQPDFLVHVQQIFTLSDDRLACKIKFGFPHPTVVRKEWKESGKTNFRPEGLDFIIRADEPCTIGYDIPFGMEQLSRKGISYLCPLSSCFMEFENGGLLLSPTTGEQAFSVNSDTGDMTLFLGTSTTSGPLKEVGLEILGKDKVKHETQWYAEPFHGHYYHNFVLYPYKGSWQSAHIPLRIRESGRKVYTGRGYPSGSASLPYSFSFVEGLPENVEITRIERLGNGSFMIRFNEKEGRRSEINCTVAGRAIRGVIQGFGIKEVVVS